MSEGCKILIRMMKFQIHVKIRLKRGKEGEMEVRKY